jgi:O-antigen/teichoic acid export membrane protein
MQAPPTAVPLRRSIGSLLVGDFANKALRLVATVVLARALTLEEFGVLNVAIVASGIGVTLTTLGLPEQGARIAATDGQQCSWLAGRVLSARLLAVVGAGGLALVTIGLASPSRVGIAVPAACMALFMSSSLDWLARGRERMRGLGVAWVLGGATVAAGALATMAGSGGAESALWAFAAGEAVVAAATWWTVRDHMPPRFGTAGLASLLRQSWPLALSTVAIYSYYANIDTLLLAALRSEAEAGLYSAPYRVFLVLNVAGVFAAYSLLPRLSRERLATGDHRPPADLRRALWVLLAYGCVVVGLAALLAEPALELIFGEAFGEAAPTFILLCTAVAWYTVGYPAGYSLIAVDQNRRFLLGALVAGILNITLNAILIPPLGIEGAGIATVGAFSVAALVWLWMREVDRGDLARLVLSLLAITLAGAFCAAAESLRVPIGVGVLVVAAAASLSRWRGPWSLRSALS